MNKFVDWPHAFLLAKTQRGKERKEDLCVPALLGVLCSLAFLARFLRCGDAGCVVIIGDFRRRQLAWVLWCENRGDFAKVTKRLRVES
jgi:hypothetical protein